MDGQTLLRGHTLTIWCNIVCTTPVWWNGGLLLIPRMKPSSRTSYDCEIRSVSPLSPWIIPVIGLIFNLPQYVTQLVENKCIVQRYWVSLHSNWHHYTRGGARGKFKNRFFSWYGFLKFTFFPGRAFELFSQKGLLTFFLSQGDFSIFPLGWS